MKVRKMLRTKVSIARSTYINICTGEGGERRVG